MMGKTNKLAWSERPHFDHVLWHGGMHECRKARNMRQKVRTMHNALSWTAKQPPDRNSEPRSETDYPEAEVLRSSVGLTESPRQEPCATGISSTGDRVHQ